MFEKTESGSGKIALFNGFYLTIVEEVGMKNLTTQVILWESS